MPQITLNMPQIKLDLPYITLNKPRVKLYLRQIELHEPQITLGLRQITVHTRWITLTLTRNKIILATEHTESTEKLEVRGPLTAEAIFILEKSDNKLHNPFC